MDKIEKIRTEIEGLKGICTAQIKANPGQTFPFVMEMTGYDKILSFLDTLSEEPDKSLEEEAEKRYEQVKSIANIKGIDGVALKRDAFIRLAQYFAEWQKGQMLKDAIKCEYDQYPAVIYLPAPLPRTNKGDIVRIIIVKEEKNGQSD